MRQACIKITDIDFGERRREDYGDITELASSIKERGLIQPLAVQYVEGAERPYLLLAGGRRYKAMMHAGITEVLVRIYDRELDEFERRSIEFAENFHRKNLSWTEEVKIQREIHDLHIEKYGEKVSTSPNAPGWSLQNTADLIGVSKPSIQKDVSLARAVDAAPELFAGCKTKADAAKILKSVGEEMIRNELVRRAKATPTASSKKALLDCYRLEDFFVGVKNIPDGSINFVELDPPYAIDLHKSKSAKDDKLDSYNEVDALDYPEFMMRVFTECYRTMSEHSWMIVWFAPEPWFELMYNMIVGAGFKTSRMCGIWVKPNGQTKWPERNLGNSYEMFFIASKGKPILNTPGRINSFIFDPVPPQKKTHPTERPIALIQELLTTFNTPGSRVLVPFLGSGNTLIAAASVNMSGIGFELNKDYQDRYIIKVHKMEG